MKKNSVKPQTQKIALPADLQELAKQCGEMVPKPNKAKEAAKEANSTLLHVNRQIPFYLEDKDGQRIMSKHLLGKREDKGTDYDLGALYMLRKLYANKKLAGVTLAFIRAGFSTKQAENFEKGKNVSTNAAMTLISNRCKSAKAGEPLLPELFVKFCLDEANKLEAKKVLKLK